MKKTVLSIALSAIFLVQGCATKDEQVLGTNKTSVVGNHMAGYEQFSIASFSADYIEQRINSDMGKMAISHRREGNTNVVTVSYNNLIKATQYLNEGEFEISYLGEYVLSAINTIANDVDGAAVMVNSHISPTSNDVVDSLQTQMLISAITREIGVKNGKFEYINKGGYRPKFESTKDFFNGNNRVEFVFFSYEL